MPSARPTIKVQSERGVVSVIAAFFLAIAIGFGFLVLDLGMQTAHRFQAHDAAEALAYANALQVISQPAPNFNQQIESDPYISTNAVAGVDAANVIINGVYTGVGTPANDQPYAPTFPPVWQDSGGATVSVQGAYTNSFFQTNTLPFMGTIAAPGTQGATATTAVNQLQWLGLRPVPARIILVMDFSRSMRLQYNTGDCAANTPSCASINVMRRDATEVIQTLTAPPITGIAIFGILPFWEVPASDPAQVVPPLAYPADMDPDQVQGHNDGMFANLNGTPTNGTATDIAAAIDAAVAMLGPTDPNDPTQGPGVIIVISDGEPDNCTDPTYSNNVTCAEEAAKASAAKAKAAPNNISIYSVLIDRELAEDPVSPSQVQGFMQAISGGPGGASSGPCTFDGTVSASSDCVIAGFVGDVPNWLTQVLTPENLKVHCLAQNILLPANSWMKWPQQTDNVYTYIVPFSTTQETALTRVATRAELDGPSYQSAGAFNFNTSAFSNGKPMYNLIETNAYTCAKYEIPALMSGSQPPTFRMRWGLPVLGAVTTISSN